MTTGRIFNIQRFSIHDGPGIRTTVFFKGCPLRCIWCGNPESITPEPSLSWLPEKCIACGDCLDRCPAGALQAGSDGKTLLDRGRCTACGRCAEVCDPKALELVGRDMTVDEVLEVVLRDDAYYRQSGGGLTLSGGEPLMQGDFVLRLLGDARALGLHACVETSGLADWSLVERLLPLVDLWLYDCKETDPRLHQKFTGFWNSEILANLRRLHAADAKVLLRCPMIPEHNARTGHLDGIAALAGELPNLQGVELLPYYDLWRAKLQRFGLTTELPETVKPPSPETVRSWNDYLRQRGAKVVA
ncbi:MAG: glycyl-radical enzyme activating protein [Thermoguttaceae bacterium]